MDQFTDKNVDFVLEWLKQEDFKDTVIESFKSNEVDGNAFTLLSEAMMKELVPAIGPLSKLLAKHKALCTQKQPITIFDDDKSDLSETQHNYTSDLENTPHQMCLESHSTDTSSDLESTPKRIKTSSKVSSFTMINDKYIKSLPDPFKFPENFSPLVASALSSKQMTPHSVEKFITEVGRAAFAFKCYPLPEEFTRVAQQCVTKYPFLSSGQGGYGHIEEGLKKRFKEFRRTPISLTRITGKVEKVEKEHESDDDVSYERNINALQAEVKKNKPNFLVISQLMDLTFKKRRCEFEDSPMHAARYIDKFPALVIYDQFVEEAQRVLKVENLRKVAFDRWTDVQPCILDLGKRERQKKSISDIFSTMDSEEYNNILPMILLVYLVPSDSRQKVDHEAIISFIPASVDIKRTATSVHSPTPTLLCCLELKKSILVVDKTVVLELPIEESAIALLISYYNFNIGYPKGFHRYFMLLEMLLLDIKQAKVDRKVQTILSCLHKSSASIEP